MDLEKNRKYIAEIAYGIEGGVFQMDKSDVLSVAVGKRGCTSYCGICKHWQGKRGVGTAGKWIFKKIALHVPVSSICAKCEVYGSMRDLTKFDDPEHIGCSCAQFESILPESTDGLPETQVFPWW